MGEALNGGQGDGRRMNKEMKTGSMLYVIKYEIYGIKYKTSVLRAPRFFSSTKELHRCEITKYSVRRFTSISIVATLYLV